MSGRRSIRGSRSGERGVVKGGFFFIKRRGERESARNPKKA